MVVLKPGDPAPAFATVDEQGQPVSLSALRGHRIGLYFYPKDNTPGCTTQACAFRDSYGALHEKNAMRGGGGSRADSGRFCSSFRQGPTAAVARARGWPGDGREAPASTVDSYTQG